MQTKALHKNINFKGFFKINFKDFFSTEIGEARYYHCNSVRSSVTLDIVSKRLKVSSKFFHPPVALTCDDLE